jgi:hypothetical protein
MAATAQPGLQVDAVELLPDVISASGLFTRGLKEKATPSRVHLIAADARRFQALPAAERWREIFALRHWAARLARSSSCGDAIRRLEDLEETRWQAIQKDLFARHGG